MIGYLTECWFLTWRKSYREDNPKKKAEKLDSLWPRKTDRPLSNIPEEFLSDQLWEIGNIISSIQCHLRFSMGLITYFKATSIPEIGTDDHFCWVLYQLTSFPCSDRLKTLLIFIVLLFRFEIWNPVMDTCLSLLFYSMIYRWLISDYEL